MSIGQWHPPATGFPRVVTTAAGQVPNESFCCLATAGSGAGGRQEIPRARWNFQVQSADPKKDGSKSDGVLTFWVFRCQRKWIASADIVIAKQILEAQADQPGWKLLAPGCKNQILWSPRSINHNQSLFIITFIYLYHDPSIGSWLSWQVRCSDCESHMASLNCGSTLAAWIPRRTCEATLSATSVSQDPNILGEEFDGH